MQMGNLRDSTPSTGNMRRLYANLWQTSWIKEGVDDQILETYLSELANDAGPQLNLRVLSLQRIRKEIL